MDVSVPNGRNLFLDVLSAIQQEQLIKRSPRGQAVGTLIEAIKKLPPTLTDSITCRITSELYRCLDAGKRHKLPSLAQGAVWSAFHALRLRQDILREWTTFITANNISSVHNQDHEMALQVLLDRMLKHIMAKQAMAATAVDCAKEVSPLTFCESNAVRYMAGYVAVKLLRKYRRGSRNATLNIKYRLFVNTLQRMKAAQQPAGDPDSPLNYSTLWLEYIDRGGLYHIGDDVFHLIHSIEMVTRQHFNFSNIKTCVPGTSISETIRDQVLNTRNIVTCWEQIANNIPSKYEKYSLELLGKITDLWITIRGHSFAKGWNAKFERKYKRGTRKTLANAGKE